MKTLVICTSIINTYRLDMNEYPSDTLQTYFDIQNGNVTEKRSFLCNETLCNEDISYMYLENMPVEDLADSVKISYNNDIIRVPKPNSISAFIISVDHFVKIKFKVPDDITPNDIEFVQDPYYNIENSAFTDKLLINPCRIKCKEIEYVGHIEKTHYEDFITEYTFQTYDENGRISTDKEYSVCCF